MRPEPGATDPAIHPLFESDLWKPALQKYGDVTRLTVVLYGVDERIVFGPEPLTPLFSLFQRHGSDPGIFAECARRCLAQVTDRPAVMVVPSYGLAVVGASMVLDGAIVGAAVAGYALVDFSQTSAIVLLARQAGIPFRELWEIARTAQPLPKRRLALYGELLQVLGDALLRENLRTRQYEEAAARVTAEMAVKDEFLAVLSHELRTPLTPILTWSRILEKTGADPEQRRKAVSSIQRNVRLQITLIDDLLDLNKIMRNTMPLDMAVHGLAELVMSAVETVAPAASQQQVGIALDLTDMPVSVEGDAGRLQQIFGNILSNAVKFTPAGGRVRVSLERSEDTAIVRIDDTGEGIASEFLPHVFDMFRQQEEGTRRRHSGLGIGLALVKRLVKMHRGSVEIASDGPGHGTRVTIWLPLASPAPGDASGDAAEGLQELHPFDGIMILVVEDTADSLDAMRRMLEMLGARVVAARDGLEALVELKKGRPDLVLCDLRMPNMDGFAFMSELARIHGPDHPPVIAVTGLVSVGDHKRTQTAGFEGYLEKPFEESELVTTVRDVLAHHHPA